MVLKVMRHVLLDLANRGGDSKPQSAEFDRSVDGDVEARAGRRSQWFEVQLGPGMPDSTWKSWEKSEIGVKYASDGC